VIGGRARLAVTVVFATVLAVAVHDSCAHAPESRRRVSSAAEPASDRPAGVAGPRVRGDAQQRPGRAATPSPERPNTVARAAAGRDEHDLELLSSIERELGRSPPREVEVLIRRRHQGADQDELMGLVQTGLPADFALRALAARWVRAVFGETNAEPSSLGRGGGRRTVQDIGAR
jgi:hypothetical protein